MNEFDYRLFESIETVTGFLEDDISRIIFKQRALANISNDVTYIYDMLEMTQSFDFLNAYDSFVEIDKNYGIYSQMDVLAWLRSRQTQKKIVLFGAGGNLEIVLKLLLTAGVFVCRIVDNNSDLTSRCGIPVVSVESSIDLLNESYIIITSLIYKEEMFQQLKKLGIKEENIFCPEDNFLISYSTDVYFDSSIWQPCADEIFVDAGSYNLYTSSQFAKWCPNYKEIYAFEPDKENYELCKKNLEKYCLQNVNLINAGLWKEKTTLNFSHQGDLGAGSCLESFGDSLVPVVSLDEILQGKECTLIKMDIEGAEMDALRGAADTIRKWKPRLAICIYHKPTDIIDIPLYIKELVPQYKMKIRHYSTYFFDTVLYAYI